MRAPRRLAVALVGLLTVAMAGCGVQVQEVAEPLPSDALPTATATPSTMPTARRTRIHFVNGRALEGVLEPIVDRSANGVMAALAAGPPSSRPNLRTLLLDPLTGQPLLIVMSVSAYGEVVIQRTDAYLAMVATDQLLLTGQVVLSMDEIGLSRVIITDALGMPVPVPLPGGLVGEGPRTASEYDELLEQ